MHTWDISPRGEKRFLDGHPWVFSNEILSPIKKLESGDLVQLISSKGRPLAIGYGNPHSLIAFRCLDRDKTTIDEQWVVEKLLQAARFREQIQVAKYSHRLVFSEADNLPGLIIDCFKTASTQQVLVVDILTAGIEKLIPDPVKTLTLFLQKCAEENLNYFAPSCTTFILKKDSSFRKLENLPIEAPIVVGDMTAEQLSDVTITVASASNARDYIQLHTNLAGGQKTGFFLDQRLNIQLLIANLPRFQADTIKVLDLFCYVGQWSKQLAQNFQLLDRKYALHAIDASMSALTY
ncbi:MAG: hypothetical protein IT287_05355, partial [Bdellovibrionaceae bacterium]|nr:hypothetical protein [Pseudobdellovibrionaceae bacterium]